ncbi:MAG: endonuclease/exonuclease/phosphatase family protein [Verrucomicrobiae bacterium]|nr:endonuclease/exonuclease/phosphatase family protein [Verrucomicrobiae bacterium]
MLRSLRSLLAIAIPALLLLLFGWVALCFLNRWDGMVPFTLVPIWAWAGLGMAGAALSWIMGSHRLSFFVFLLWLLTGVIASDETPGLFRGFLSALSAGKRPADLSPAGSGESRPNRLRVVTLNCALGNSDAAAQVRQFAPDIVLLQEAPSERRLAELAYDIWGADGTLLRSERCAILARGRLSQIYTEPVTSSLCATLRIPGGPEIDIVNCHLHRALPRFDLWKRECWEALSGVRVENRRLLRSLLDSLPERGNRVPRIAAGDFGAPPSDDIFRLLRNADYLDSFHEVGRGWGNTFPSAQSLLRIDQIWSSPGLAPRSSEAARAEPSDHRMVVTEFSVE